MIYMGVISEAMHCKVSVPIDVEEGGGALILTAQEKDDLDSGKEVVKLSGDYKGHFKITVKMTRPKTKAARFRGL